MTMDLLQSFKKVKTSIPWSMVHTEPHIDANGINPVPTQSSWPLFCSIHLPMHDSDLAVYHHPSARHAQSICLHSLIICSSFCSAAFFPTSSFRTVFPRDTQYPSPQFVMCCFKLFLLCDRQTEAIPHDTYLQQIISENGNDACICCC